MMRFRDGLLVKKFPLCHPYEEGTKIRLEVWSENDLKSELVQALQSVDDDKVGLSLIEIDQPEKYMDGGEPKQALRTGFAKSRRITQFIHPEKDNETEKQRRHRLMNSFFDLLTDINFFQVAFAN